MEIYNGHFRNGERNGEGTEYYKHTFIIKYFGEYLNGKRNGKGEEYDIEDHLIFEGEYLNDKQLRGIKHIMFSSKKYEINHIKGKGKEYDYYSGKLIYEGEYLNGRRHGKGKEYNDRGEYKLIFEGIYKNDKKW